MPIYLPEPLEHQQPAFSASCRIKLLNCGRRWGKDRLEFTASVAGHGPQVDDKPMFPGAAQGWTVVWVARDYTQAKGIWLEEFIPRFKPTPEVYMNEGDFRVMLPNGGSVCIFSDKNVDSIRGLGKKVKGFVTNEGAHFDLQHAWLRVVRPILADNQGWGLIGSTPIAGSYFNQLATEVLGGARGRIAPTGPWEREWGYWTGTIYDNPTIPKVEADALVAEYPPGSDVLREEIYAELLEGGRGLAFPEWDATVHVVPRFTPSEYWRVAAGMDWGIRAPSVVLLCASDHEGNVVAFKEYMWREKNAYEAGWDFVSELLVSELPWPEFLTCDSAMDDGSERVGGKTILSEFQRGMSDRTVGLGAPSLMAMAAPKGPGSRSIGYNLLKKMLSWGPRQEDGSLHPKNQPLLRIVGSECPYLTKTMPLLRRKPLPKADAAGVVMDGKLKDDVDENQPDTHCLVGSTPITTSRGEVPIAEVRVGDQVLTRRGWSPVLRSWMTSPDATVYDVVLSDGTSLTMTASHPVWIQGVGFVRCDALRYGDRLLSSDEVLWKYPRWSLSESKSGAASGITGPGATSFDLSQVPGFTYTEPSGWTWWGPSPRSTTFTTATVTAPITPSATSTASRVVSTSAAIVECLPTNSAPPAPTTLDTTRPQPTLNSPRNSGLAQPAADGKPWDAWRLLVRCAAGWSKRLFRDGPSSAEGPVKRVRSVTAAGTAPVYNLSVGTSPEFFAGGVLVHNSYDALRYFLQGMIPQADKPTTVIPVDRHPGLIPGTAIRRNRVRSLENETEEELISMEAQGVLYGGRYGPR